MNILITSHDLQPQFIGGDKRVSLTLAKEWMRQGHKVLLLCFSGDVTDKQMVVEGIEQLHFPDEKVLCSEQNVAYFRHVVQEREVDIVLQQHVAIDEFARLSDAVRDLVKVVSVLHFDVRYDENILANDFFICYRNGGSIVKYAIDLFRYVKYLCRDKARCRDEVRRRYAFFVKHSDCVSLLSERMIEDFKSCLPSGCEVRLMAVNNPVVLSVSDKNIINSKEKMVVWCGRLEYGPKRLDRMLRIWKKINLSHSDWQLKILGSGDWDYWKKQIADRGINNAEVVGFCNPAEYYRKAAILCMTSTSEGFPMVLVEGQSYGCVPMAYNSFAALPDIITDGENGFSVKAFDEKEYLRKLSLLMDDVVLRERMALAGLKSIERFDSAKIADKWMVEFEKILEK